MNNDLIKKLISTPLNRFSIRNQKFIASVKYFYKTRKFITESQTKILYKIFFEDTIKVEKDSDDKEKAELFKSTVRIFNPAKETLKIIKRYNGKYRTKGCFWAVPLSLELVYLLQDAKIFLDKSLLNWLDKETKTITSDVLPDKYYNATLRPYQKIGVNFMIHRQGKVLLADEMGLGKTIQSLAYISIEKNTLPALIVCPSSVKEKWADEIKKWTNLTTTIIEGMYNSECSPPKTDTIIINYDILHYDKKGKTYIRPDVKNIKTIIIDECHKLKNRKSKRFKATSDLTDNNMNIIALTGTPIENRPIDLWNILYMVNRNVIPDFWTYAHKYCDARLTTFGWDMSGANNVNQLHDILVDTVMLRRKKKDVAKELPEKTYSVIPLRWDPLIYEETLKKSTNDFKQNKSQSKGMVEVEKYKYAAVMAKLNYAVDWIKDYLDNDNKLVVFTRRIDTLNTLMIKLKGYKPVKIDGSVTNTKDRQKAIHTFQNNPDCKLFLGNMKASGTGIDLTEANSVAFVEFGWTPAEHSQCEDRAHRIGQKNNVTVYYLIAKGTIEENVLELLQRKKKIVDSITDGVQTEDFDMVAELVKATKRKQNNA